MKTWGSHRNDVALSLLFVLALMGFVFVYYLALRLIPFFDAVQFFSPYFTLLADFTRSGQFLLWNPYQNCGSPDIGYSELGGLSPFTLGLALLTGGGYYGFLIYWLAIWTVFGVGICLLAVHLRAPRWATMAITAGMMFSGFMLGCSTHTSIIYGFSFLPLILWRLDTGLTGRGWGPRWSVVEAGALYGLSALASHPQMVALSGMYLGLWALGRAFFPDEAEDDTGGEGVVRRTSRTVVALTIMMAVALAVLGPVYVNFFHEAAGYSERACALPRPMATMYGRLPPTALASMASPYLAALTEFNTTLWPESLGLLSGCHAGAIMPALAITFYLLHPRRRFAWWVAAIGLFYLAASVGNATPVRGLLYDLIWPTRFFRHSSIFRAYCMFSFGVMAMMAARDLADPKISVRAWKTLCAVSIALAPIMTVALVGTLRTIYNPGDCLAPAILHFILTWGGAVAVAAYGWRSAQRGDIVRARRLLVCLAALDAAGSLYLSRSLMVAPRDRFSFLETDHVHGIDLSGGGLKRFRLPPGVSINNSHLVSKRPMLEGYHQMAHRFHSSLSLTPLTRNWTNEPVLSSAVIGPDRTWFCASAVMAAPSDSTFTAFVQRSRELGAMPLVLSRSDDLLRLPARGEAGPDDLNQSWAIRQLPPCDRIPAQVVRYSPTRLTLEVDAPEKGWLLVTDRWSRSWTAFRDGHPTELLGGNFLFRAVPVERGRQMIDFVFRPFLFPLLLWVSWGTMALVAGVSVYRARRGRSRRTPSPTL